MVLTPEQLAAQRAGLLNPDGTLNMEAVMRHQNANSWAGGGRGSFAVNPIYTDDGRGSRDESGGGGEGGAMRNGQTVTGWRVADRDLGQVDLTDRSEWNGVGYQEFDAQGNRTGNGTYQGLMDSEPMSQTMVQYAAMLAGAAALGGAFAGVGIPGVGGGAGATGAGGSGAFLGEGVASGIPAWDAAAINSGLSLSTPGGAAFNAAMDSQAANVGIDAAGGNALSGYQAAGATPSSVSINGVTYGAGAPTGGSWTDSARSLMNGQGGRVLGAATSLLGGGAGGGGGGGGEGTSERRMDPRMDALTYGDLFQRSQGLLAEQMTPERMAGYRTMQNRGQTLMNSPVAPNGTARFFGSNHLG